MADSTPIPDWAQLQRMMDAKSRQQGWRSAGLWALDVLAGEIGEDWPARWWGRHRRLPPELILGTYLPAAFAGLLELAVRLRVLEAVAGIAPIRRGLAGDLRDEGMQHIALQLEVASLAVQSGLDAAMETRLKGHDNPVGGLCDSRR